MILEPIRQATYYLYTHMKPNSLEVGGVLANPSPTWIEIRLEMSL